MSERIDNLLQKIGDDLLTIAIIDAICAIEKSTSEKICYRFRIINYIKHYAPHVVEKHKDGSVNGFKGVVKQRLQLLRKDGQISCDNYGTWSFNGVRKPYISNRKRVF